LRLWGWVGLVEGWEEGGTEFVVDEDGEKIRRRTMLMGDRMTARGPYPS